LGHYPTQSFTKEERKVLTIHIDADACPVKPEIYRVALRYGLEVNLVSNSYLNVPDKGKVRLVVVKNDFDSADDWIAEHAEVGDIVITADIPLAARCLAAGARALGPRGEPFTEDNIGDVLATRNLLAEVREYEEIGGGPPPFQQRDRSLFLQRLDEMVNAIKREQVVSSR
jgi:uncharacterized protein